MKTNLKNSKPMNGFETKAIDGAKNASNYITVSVNVEKRGEVDPKRHEESDGDIESKKNRWFFVDDGDDDGEEEEEGESETFVNNFDKNRAAIENSLILKADMPQVNVANF